MPWFYEEGKALSRERVLELVRQVAAEAQRRIAPNPKKVLLLPPDATRAHCGAGWMAEELYRVLSETADVHVMPTLGQHVPHTPEQNRWMFGSIPEEKIHVHDWRHGVKRIGEIPGDYVKDVSGGSADWPIPIELNRMFLEGGWDLIIHIGHIVPHEVMGFASHNKNYFVGLGGKETICSAHMMSACYGLEKSLGNVMTPLRRCYNKAEAEYLSHLPDVFIQVVMAPDDRDELVHTGFYAGDDLDTYLMGAEASRRQNITIVKPLKKVVALMQGDEFYSTWVANKAVYRTRMAMADGGELLVLAPGLKRFGEQPEVDALIRKYGYVGTEKVMALWRENEDLQDLAHGTAHLIHGSSEGRFSITYAPGGLTEEEIRGVNYGYADLDEALARYDPEKMVEGWNTMPDGEEVYFIGAPWAGLWSTEEKLYRG